MKHTILFLTANPFGTDRLALDREAREIQIELERSGHRDRFEFVTRWAAEPLDLLRELRKLKPTIVHFSGHGGPDVGDAHRAVQSPHRDVAKGGSSPGAASRRGLYFEGSDGSPRFVSVEALEQTFGAAGSSVKLVVLNSCYSDVQAQALVSHVGCVVGMRGSVSDDAARSFAIGFYGGLGERESIDAAYKQGCAAISLQGFGDCACPQFVIRPGIDATKLVLAADAVETTADRDFDMPVSQPSQHRPDAATVRTMGTRLPIMGRIEFLGWAAQLLGRRHTGGSFYVTTARNDLELGIDAGASGRMRVHLFSKNDSHVAWMRSLPATPGPMPDVAHPVLRQGTTGGSRYYYGFTWQHAGDSYANEQTAVSAFVKFLRNIALQRNISLG